MKYVIAAPANRPDNTVGNGFPAGQRVEHHPADGSHHAHERGSRDARRCMRSARVAHNSERRRPHQRLQQGVEGWLGVHKPPVSSKHLLLRGDVRG